MEEFICYFDIFRGFGNVVFNYIGVCVVDCDIVEYRYNFYGYIFRV